MSNEETSPAGPSQVRPGEGSLSPKGSEMRFSSRALLAVLAAATIASCTSSGTASSTAPGPARSLEGRWGVELAGIRPSAAGYMLDFRFWVRDAERAAPLFDRGTKPYLVDEATGAKFLVPNPPKVGPLRTSDPPKEGRRYFIFFANPGRLIEPGRRVTVVIGDFRAEHLVVE